MIKPKVWLVQNGHKPAGYEDTRGRMDGAAKALVMEAVKNGAQIEGFSLTTPAPTSTVLPSVQRAPVSNVKTIAELPAYRYNEDTHVAHSFEGGKKVSRSLREACRHCRVSLVVCHCPAPEIVSRDGRTSVRVYIESR
jgi:hypothetical protein